MNKIEKLHLKKKKMYNTMYIIFIYRLMGKNSFSR